MLHHQRHIDLVGALLDNVTDNEGHGEQRASAADPCAAVHHDGAVGLVQAVSVVVARCRWSGGDSI